MEAQEISGIERTINIKASGGSTVTVHITINRHWIDLKVVRAGLDEIFHDHQPAGESLNSFSRNLAGNWEELNGE